MKMCWIFFDKKCPVFLTIYDTSVYFILHLIFWPYLKQAFKLGKICVSAINLCKEDCVLSVFSGKIIQDVNVKMSSLGHFVCKCCDCQFC